MLYGLSCFFEHNSSNKMTADRAICQGGIEMRWPGCSDGRWREREINRFSAAPSTPCSSTYANSGLKNYNYCFGTIEPRLSWNFSSWLMMVFVSVCILHQNQGSFIAQEIIMCCHYNDRHIMGNGHILEWCLFASSSSAVLVFYLYLWGGPQRPLGVETYICRLPVLTWRTLCAHPMQHTIAHTNATHNCTHLCTALFFRSDASVVH